MSAFDLKYHEYNKMCAFQDARFTPEQIDRMECAEDIANNLKYTWVYTLDGKKYHQTLDRKTGEITLTTIGGIK